LGLIKPGLLLFFVLLISAVICALFVNLAGAQTYDTITILSDGGVEGTDKIHRDGDIYTFTGDIYGFIMVEKSGITIDGAGYTFQGVDYTRGIVLVGHAGGSFNPCSDVVVKNLRIYNSGGRSIYTASNNNSFIDNTFDSSGIHLVGGGGEGNLIKRNFFNNSYITIDYNSGGKDVVTENDFVSSGIFVTLSRPPQVEGNYWSNYTTKYPNAKEIGNSGIWDTPYDYDIMPNSSHGTDPCVDNNPLVHPVSFEISNDPLVENESEPFPTTLGITAILVVVAISIGLLVYFKKHKYASSF